MKEIICFLSGTCFGLIWFARYLANRDSRYFEWFVVLTIAVVVGLFITINL